MRTSRFALIAAFVMLSMLLPLAALAQDGATVAVQLPVAGEGADTFTTEVSISSVEGLLGFQFDINFDPAALAVETIELGPFLASTGRAPQPLGPDMNKAADGAVVFGGYTLGTPDQPGASGDGVLATITWRSLQGGAVSVNLSNVQLAGSGGQALPLSPATEEPVTLEVAGSSGSTPSLLGIPWFVWLGILLVGLVVVMLVIMQRRQKS